MKKKSNAKKSQSPPQNDNNADMVVAHHSGCHGRTRKGNNNLLNTIQKFFSLAPEHDDGEKKNGSSDNINDNYNNKSAMEKYIHRRKPNVLLYNCETYIDHYQKIDDILLLIRNEHGLKGLNLCGFDYITQTTTTDHNNNTISTSGKSHDPIHSTTDHSSCSNTMTKLYHVESQTFISKTNRLTYIADGSMYEEIVRLCQEYAHDLMIQFGHLQWVLVDPGPNGETRDVGNYQNVVNNPIRILVSKELVGNNDEDYDDHDDDDLSLGVVENDNENDDENDIDDGLEQHLSYDENDTPTMNDNQQYQHDNTDIVDDDHALIEDFCHNTTASIEEDDDVSIGDDHHLQPDHEYYDDDQLQSNQNMIKSDTNILETPQSLRRVSSKFDKSSTLLITTGKGKVRAGIFSRQHLLISSIESSTALPIIRDARRNGLKIIIFDPNARGDKNGTFTYDQSMRFVYGYQTDVDQNEPKKKRSLFHQSDTLRTSPIYILAHSASGSHLNKFLSTKGQHLINRIQSIAFTDSTHNVQWLLKSIEKQIENSAQSKQVCDLVQDPNTSLYIRSSNIERDDDWEKHHAGDICNTDQYWKHRFGDVKTIWAGTIDHSLTNFAAHEQIWDHFEKCCE